ncbi:MAG TPA: hypothetical protein VGO09_11380 [Flavisolibacter sp.]|jgi:hypothetical protein|nr:hypothetical protein [Flavisolibacter sp.]
MRKSILFLAGFFIIILSAQAQITKGSILLGGGFSFSTANSIFPNTPDSKLTQFTISPSVGLAVKDNSVVGIFFIYSHARDNDNLQNNKFYEAGAYWRKYLPLGKSFYFFTNTQLTYLYGEWKYTTIDNLQLLKQSTINIGIYPGVTYALNKKFHLEASLPNLINLGYTHTENFSSGTTGQTSYKQNSVALYTNLSASNPFNFGFRFVIGK